MKVTALEDVERRPRRVAVGTFDGVHLGHREVIAGADTVLTFEPHPAAVVAPAGAPRLLTTLERKAELVAGLGVDELVVIGFDRDFAARSAEAFVDDVLVGALRATHVSVGENFRFGHKARGDAALLAADERFATRIVPLLEIDGEVVSSSHIRGLVLGGAVEYADRLLGAPFTVIGEVAHGDERGRTLGYPTANLVPQDGLVVPGHGVYACRARTPDGAVRVAATNVGVRPMFVTGRGELIEAYLVDYDGDLYGRPLTVEFLKRLRGEKRFGSVDALVEQMARDVQDARARGVSDPLRMVVVVRRGAFAALDAAGEAVGAAAVRCVARFEGSEDWGGSMAAWRPRPGKVVLRARSASQWTAVLQEPGGVAGDGVVALAPRRRSERGALLQALQAMTTALEPPPAGAGPTPGAVTYLLNPRLAMSSGKTLAQVAHAAVMAAERPELRAWAEAGSPARLLRAPEDAFAALCAAGDLAARVVDAGLTEVAPGTVTVLALAPAAGGPPAPRRAPSAAAIRAV